MLVLCFFVHLIWIVGKKELKKELRRESPAKWIVQAVIGDRHSGITFGVVFLEVR